MKRTAFYLMLLLSISFLTNCTTPARYADPFYNFDDRYFPRVYLPLLKPIKAVRDRSSSPWSVFLSGLWVFTPNNSEAYSYDIEELEKFAIRNGVIMAYSAYVNKEVDAYIQDNYYHWFVIVPDKNITKGFHTEEEFLQYIQTLDIQDPDWQTPDEAYDTFAETGCLDWIPDCGGQ